VPARTPTQRNVDTVLPDDYLQVFSQLKHEVNAARLEAHVAVTQRLLRLYHVFGSTLSERQTNEAWGSKVVATLSADLRREFPGMSGLSERNLIYTRSFAQAWPDPTALDGPLGQVQWGHIIVMLDKLHDREVRDWYAERIANSGWSRAVFTHQIKSRLHERIGAAPSNFPATLADEDNDYTAQLLKDPYNFDFLGITERIAERDLEQRLMNSVQEFLLELGDGFALYKRQHRFILGGKEFVIDLVFFNVLQNRFVIVELKIDEFEPGHVGQIQFYVEWAERHLRQATHLPTVGILLVAGKADVVVRYALAASTTPLAVATYTYDKLPTAARRDLPSNDRLRKAVLPPAT
jgi:predicted nuclease of restriction endonuclease-like (RecB) superfamily